MTVRTKLFTLVGVFVVGLALFNVLSFRSMPARVEASDYRDVIQAKDLIADILPPPEYIIESYLIALQSTGTKDPAELQQLHSRWNALEQEYSVRHAFWIDELSDKELRHFVLETAYEPAMAFYALGNRELWPAISKGEIGRASQLVHADLKQLYSRHRAGIDRAVSRGNALVVTYQEAAAASIMQRKEMLAGLGIAITLAGAAVGWMIARGLSRSMTKAADLLGRVSKRDLSKRLDITTRDEFGNMAEGLNKALDGIGDALHQVRLSSETLTGASRQLSAAAGEMSSDSQEQASSLEETAASLEALTATVKQNADSAQQASDLAQGASDVAKTGGAVTLKAVTAMQEINESSRRIAEIITTIDEIAFQTNLLALNAAVEAARAGEQGRGFAVVATEVRNLAQRSASAAKEIKGLIEDSVRKVDTGSELVDESGRTLKDIVTSVQRVACIIAEIAAASREQSSGIEQLNDAVSQMDRVTQSNAAQTEEVSATAESLSNQAEYMRQIVTSFELQAIPSAQRTTAAKDELRTSLSLPAHSLPGALAGEASLKRTLAPLATEAA